MAINGVDWAGVGRGRGGPKLDREFACQNRRAAVADPASAPVFNFCRPRSRPLLEVFDREHDVPDLRGVTRSSFSDRTSREGQVTWFGSGWWGLCYFGVRFPDSVRITYQNKPRERSAPRPCSADDEEARQWMRPGPGGRKIRRGRRGMRAIGKGASRGSWVFSV
jgi:hypothetical protein